MALIKMPNKKQHKNDYENELDSKIILSMLQNPT